MRKLASSGRVCADEFGLLVGKREPLGFEHEHSGVQCNTSQEPCSSVPDCATCDVPEVLG